MTILLRATAVGIRDRLQPADVVVESGTMVALVGPNGSGKTSLLRALAGIESGSGSVGIGGEDLLVAAPARRTRLLSFLPASRDLAWPIPVRDVIAMGLGRGAAEEAQEWIEKLELQPFADRAVSALSTGERARVLLARCLAASPKVLLLDEPLSNLDPYWVLRTLEIVRGFALSGGAAMVSLHDLERMSAFDRVIVMDQGRIVADGPPTAIRAGSAISDAFGIELDGSEWRIRRPAGRRSSP